MQIHTAYDVMKEFLITDAELVGQYGIPKIPKTFIHPGKDTVDFAESFSRKIKNHRELDVNFYVNDVQFQRLWNQPDKYMEHLKCFHAVIMPDFSISVGKNGMPLAMCLWNKYRNHALAYYMILNDIPVIPNVNILPEYCWDWCFDGLPERKHSCLLYQWKSKEQGGTVGILRWFQGNGTQIEATSSYHCWKNPGRIGNRHRNYKL